MASLKHIVHVKNGVHLQCASPDGLDLMPQSSIYTFVGEVVIVILFSVWCDVTNNAICLTASGNLI